MGMQDRIGRGAVAVRRPVRAALREATDAAHARLDAGFSQLRMDLPGDYALFLSAHAMALGPLEDAVSRALGERQGRRAGALAADLAGLGAAMPSPYAAPDLDPDAAWGAAYVLEGSRLGARVLETRARRAGHPVVTANLRFLSQRSGPRWPDFLDTLERALPTAASADRAARGARAAFGLFEMALRSAREGEGT